VVLLVGTAVMGIGATTLYLIFRAYGTSKVEGTTQKALMAGLIFFIFLCCMGLLALSYH